MIDRDKVINGLEQFRSDLKPFCGNHADWERFDAALAMLKEQEAREQCLKTKCIICPHCDNCDVDENGLLKEQEAVEPVLDSFLHKRCPSCRALLNGKFCHECGQAVKWDA